NSYGTQALLGRVARDLSAGQIVKTVPLVPLQYPQNGVAVDLHAIGSLLYFYVLDGGAGRELWRSDGTAAGTFMVKDIAPGSKSSGMPGIAQLRGNIGVFAASPDAFNVVPSDLWITDGTSAGTVKLL